MDERRHNSRQRVLKGALIFSNGERSSIDCMVRNISGTGARIKAEGAPFLPGAFDLLINQDNLLYPCKIVWRTDTEAGVQFIGAPKNVAPHRKIG